MESAGDDGLVDDESEWYDEGKGLYDSVNNFMEKK